MTLGGGRAGLPGRRLRPVGPRLDRRCHDAHAVRLWRSGAVLVVLPMARHRAGPRAEPVLLDRPVPSDGHQPAGPDLGHGPEPAAGAGHLDLGPGGLAQRASTLTPALTAFTAFVVVRRWAPWTPAAFVAGLLYGFSPFVLTSLEFAHLMTAALMVLPLILAALDEILLRQRHRALWSGVVLAALAFVQFFLSTEVLAIVVMTAVAGVFALVLYAALWPTARPWRHVSPTRPRRWDGGGGRRGAVGLARLVRPGRAGPPVRAGVARHPASPGSCRRASWRRQSDRARRVHPPGRLRGDAAGLGRVPRLGPAGRPGRRHRGALARACACGSSGSCWSSPAHAPWRAPSASGSRCGSFRTCPCSTT